MFKEKQITLNVHVDWSAIFYGVLLALASSLALSFIAGIIFYYGGIAEIWTSAISSAIFSCSVFAGGLFTGLKAGQKGLLHGLVVGIIFILLILILTWFLPAEMNWLIFLKKVVYALIAGALGGILGVR